MMTKKDPAVIRAELKGLRVDSPVPDKKKRLFLKLLGVAGLGVVGSMLLPKRADAYVFGSTPASNVVGLKNILNAKINPATEDTLSGIKETSDKLTFDIDGNLLTANGGDDAIVGVKNVADTRINPATQETLTTLATTAATLTTNEDVILLRRIAKQMESLATVDSSNRQRVTVEGATITSGTITTVTTVTTVANATALGGVDARYLYIDTARNAYANGIRNNL
jgi:hypothetical protein